jgi:hypothetical protein
MPDHDSIEQRLTDFYHRSRVAMNGPVPRWDPAAARVVKHGWGRQLMFAGAAAVFIVAAFAGARYLRENQSPPAGQNQAVTSPTAEASPTPHPTPKPSILSANCKLPLSWSDPSGHMSGGFVSFPGAAFAPDSGATGLTTPFGAGWVSYDAPMGRWVPVDRAMLSPDGATYLYGTLRNGNEYHAVDVRTGADLKLWGSDQLFRIFGLDNTYAYGMLASSAGAHLWKLPLDGSQAVQLRVNGIWLFVNHGAAWGTGSASLPQGAPFSLQRLDLQNNTVSTWIELSGPGSLVGFDASGAPIVQVGGPGGDVVVAPSQGVQRTVAQNFYFAKGTAGIAHLPALGDSHGIWLAGAEGIYLSVDGVASKQSFVPAYLAGPCS